jgi:hypothetical protein
VLCVCHWARGCAKTGQPKATVMRALSTPTANSDACVPRESRLADFPPCAQLPRRQKPAREEEGHCGGSGPPPPCHSTRFRDIRLSLLPRVRIVFPPASLASPCLALPCLASQLSPSPSARFLGGAGGASSGLSTSSAARKEGNGIKMELSNRSIHFQRIGVVCMCRSFFLVSRRHFQAASPCAGRWLAASAPHGTATATATATGLTRTRQTTTHTQEERNKGETEDRAFPRTPVQGLQLPPLTHCELAAGCWLRAGAVGPCSLGGARKSVCLAACCALAPLPSLSPPR